MRRSRRAWIGLWTVLVALIAAAPAHAIVGVYAPQANVATTGGSLMQYAVGPGGTLAPAGPDLPLGATPQDITITPDARFVYVATAAADGSGAIALFDRIADNGRLVPNAVATTAPAPGPVRGILVNPQNSRVIYGQAGSIVSRAIAGDGSLGAPVATPVPTGSVPADVRSLAMTADGRNLYASDVSVGSVRVWLFDVDPASGTITPKAPAFVSWPGVPGGPTAGAGRMAITPQSTFLYLATDTPNTGIGHWAIGSEGALPASWLEAPQSDGYAEAAVATSVSGDAVWAPSAGGTSAAPERIRQFRTQPFNGILAPLDPPAVNYVVGSPARDLVPSPDGTTLYLGQRGTVGEWNVAPGGALSHRANVPPSPNSNVENAGIALTPSRAPVAAFTATPGTAGQTTAFDATASNDPDGTIVRYDWDFGDGATALNAGPTPSHVYASAGTRTVTLAVTDADGTSTTRIWNGRQMLRNGGVEALAARSFTIENAAAPPDPPVRPHKGRSVTVEAERGTILVRVPGSRRYVPIGSLTEIPLGSIVDARKGRARITAEVDARTGRTQSAVFYDWFFRVLQTKGAKPITEARLVKGSFKNCLVARTRAASSGAPASIAAVAAAAGQLRAQSAATRKKSKRKVRQLWGRGTGSFRTGGKRSAATVRGTTWLVQDRCDATITRVKVGRVDVRDFRLKKTIRLRAKTRRSTYFAR